MAAIAHCLAQAATRRHAAELEAATKEAATAREASDAVRASIAALRPQLDSMSARAGETSASAARAFKDSERRRGEALAEEEELVHSCVLMGEAQVARNRLLGDCRAAELSERERLLAVCRARGSLRACRGVCAEAEAAAAEAEGAAKRAAAAASGGWFVERLLRSAIEQMEGRLGAAEAAVAEAERRGEEARERVDETKREDAERVAALETERREVERRREELMARKKGAERAAAEAAEALAAARDQNEREEEEEEEEQEEEEKEEEKEEEEAKRKRRRSKGLGDASVGRCRGKVLGVGVSGTLETFMDELRAAMRSAEAEALEAQREEAHASLRLARYESKASMAQEQEQEGRGADGEGRRGRGRCPPAASPPPPSLCEVIELVDDDRRLPRCLVALQVLASRHLGVRLTKTRDEALPLLEAARAKGEGVRVWPLESLAVGSGGQPQGQACQHYERLRRQYGDDNVIRPMDLVRVAAVSTNGSGPGAGGGGDGGGGDGGRGAGSGGRGEEKATGQTTRGSAQGCREEPAAQMTGATRLSVGGSAQTGEATTTSRNASRNGAGGGSGGAEDATSGRGNTEGGGNGVSGSRRDDDTDGSSRFRPALLAAFGSALIVSSDEIAARLVRDHGQRCVTMAGNVHEPGSLRGGGVGGRLPLGGGMSGPFEVLLSRQRSRARAARARRKLSTLMQMQSLAHGASRAAAAATSACEEEHRCNERLRSLVAQQEKEEGLLARGQRGALRGEGDDGDDDEECVAAGVEGEMIAMRTAGSQHIAALRTCAALLRKARHGGYTEGGRDAHGKGGEGGTRVAGEPACGLERDTVVAALREATATLSRRACEARKRFEAAEAEAAAMEEAAAASGAGGGEGGGGGLHLAGEIDGYDEQIAEQAAAMERAANALQRLEGEMRAADRKKLAPTTAFSPAVITPTPQSHSVVPLAAGYTISSLPLPVPCPLLHLFPPLPSAPSRPNNKS